MSDSDREYLKRAELIRKRLLERAKSGQEQSKRDGSGRRHPGSLTQKLKPILGRLEEINDDNSRIQRNIREESDQIRKKRGASSSRKKSGK